MGQRIKSARSTNGITQETLAEQSQLAPRTIQKIEAGEITILISTLRRIRTALDCDFNDLLPE